MSTDQLGLAVHLIGVILWVGGAVAVATSASKASGDPNPDALSAARRAMNLQVHPGMALAWAGGLTMLIPSFTVRYAAAGWMHGKLTLLLILSALTGVLAARIRKAVEGTRPITNGFLRAMWASITIGMAVVVLLAVLKPGG